MKIVHLPSDLHDLPRPLAFVPTMGALHEGHLELVRQARKKGQTVVVSVFVNPTQFGPNEDFTRYPRNLERDAELAGSAGADFVYAPSVETMYPRGVMTKVVVPEVTELFEGSHRPGHFDGVATVVLKLFNQVRPDVALFGRKDLQQCAVIRRMVEDLDLQVGLEFVPTFREADGLAMSSRNVYLSTAERAAAPLLHAVLSESRERILRGGDPGHILDEERRALGQFEIDYLAFISSKTFQPIHELEAGSAIIVAARLGKTRLIDNVEL